MPLSQRRRCSLALGSMLITIHASYAQTENMPAEVIKLWPGTAPGSAGYDQREEFNERDTGNGWVSKVSQPTLSMYLPPADARVGTAVVVCPGGGYSGLSIEKEGSAMAAWFVERGVVAGVLKYRHGGGQHQHPVPLSDAQRAMRIMRTNAQRWNLAADRIGVVGFSAGGHLASSVGTHFDEGDSSAEDLIEQAGCRPDFLVLVYPVITMDQAVTHGGSRKNLLGKSPEQQLVEQLSSDRQVSPQTGPTFLAHASDDQAVPVENSLRFYRACIANQVPAELHVYETGGHGFGFYRGNRPADRWPDQLEGWLKGRGLIR